MVPPEDGNVVCLICVGVFCSVRSPFLGTMLCQFFHATEKNVERVARCYATCLRVIAMHSVYSLYSDVTIGTLAVGGWHTRSLQCPVALLV